MNMNTLQLPVIGVFTLKLQHNNSTRSICNGMMNNTDKRKFIAPRSIPRITGDRAGN